MVTSALARPLGWRFMATAPGDPPDRISAGHTSGGSGAMPIVVLLLIGVVLVLGTMIKGMLATVAMIMGQVIRLFAIVLLALVAALVLLSGLLSGPATGDAPAPAPSSPPSATAAPGAPRAGHPVPPKRPAQPARRLG